MNIEIIAQIIGFGALILGVTGFLQKDDKRLRLIMIAQSLTLCAHFVALGQFTAAVTNIVTASRTAASLFSWGKKFAPVFYVAVLAFGYWTYALPINLLPIISGLITTTAFFYLSGIKMRLSLVCASCLWIVHNAVVGSIGPLLMESFMTCAGLYRIYRLNIEHKKATGSDIALTP